MFYNLVQLWMYCRPMSRLLEMCVGFTTIWSWPVATSRSPLSLTAPRWEG